MKNKEQLAADTGYIPAQPDTIRNMAMFDKYTDIVSVDQVMSMLNIGKSTAYSLLQSGQIQHVRVGRKYIIPKQSVIDFVNCSCYNDTQITDGRLRSVEKGDMI